MPPFYIPAVASAALIRTIFPCYISLSCRVCKSVHRKNLSDGGVRGSRIPFVLARIIRCPYLSSRGWGQKCHSSAQYGRHKFRPNSACLIATSRPLGVVHYGIDASSRAKLSLCSRIYLALYIPKAMPNIWPASALQIKGFQHPIPYPDFTRRNLHYFQRDPGCQKTVTSYGDRGQCLGFVSRRTASSGVVGSALETDL
jgi:hypothetical protein